MLKERNIKASQPSTGGKGWRGRLKVGSSFQSGDRKEKPRDIFFALPVPTARGGRRDGWGRGKVGQDQEPRTKRGGNKTGRTMRIR